MDSATGEMGFSRVRLIERQEKRGYSPFLIASSVRAGSCVQVIAPNAVSLFTTAAQECDDVAS